MRCRLSAMVGSIGLHIGPFFWTIYRGQPRRMIGPDVIGAIWKGRLKVDLYRLVLASRRHQPETRPQTTYKTWTWATNHIDNTWASATNHIDKTWTSATNHIDKTWTSATNHIDKTWTSATNHIDKAWTSATNRIDKTWTSATNHIDKTWTSATHHIDKTWTSATNRIDKTWTSATNRIDKTWTSATNHIDKTWTSATNHIDIFCLFEWEFYSQPASKVIFRARTYDCITYCKSRRGGHLEWNIIGFDILNILKKLPSPLNTKTGNKPAGEVLAGLGFFPIQDSI